jgi:Cof subfamily protein (haloacid dehalogenase superfamily)
MKINAICTDIDGTLLDSRRELSPRTIRAIKNLNATIPVILASSRMPGAMRHLQDELGILHHPLICFNGGYVLHYSSGATQPVVLDSVQIPARICSSIAAMARSTEIHVSLYTEDQWFAPARDQWAEREERITKVSANITDLETVLERWNGSSAGAHKVMCMGPEHQMDVMERELNRLFHDTLHLYRSRPTYLEIAPRSISKGTALALVLEKLYGISMQEVMAFGDNYNDTDLLSMAGLGIAVGNAREEVKAVAKEITLNSIEDGVAVAIEKYCV